MVYCSRCGTLLAVGDSSCPQCGTPRPAEGASTVHHAGDTTVHVHNVTPAKARGTSQGLAIVALLLNVLVWPGLGSLVAGEGVGWAQGFLFLGGLVLSVVLVGIPLLIAAWIWGIVTGIQLIDRAA